MPATDIDPQFPLYIVSKGRSQYMMTSKALSKIGVRHHIVVEPQEVEQYEAAVAKLGLLATILPLDMSYKTTYELLDGEGMKKSTGPGPARNFAWAHSKSLGAAWHWVMDDNIMCFRRLHNNQRNMVSTGACFRAMEDFVLRYTNIGMAGPQYYMFCPSRKKWPPFVTNTRIYSCNLIRNDLPFRWRGRYNEDTILSLDMLTAGWCTVQFNAFLQHKMPTQQMKGGNTAEFYHKEGEVKEGEKYADTGTVAKSKMLAAVYPAYAKVTWRFGRWNHSVNYNDFKTRTLILKPGFVPPAEPNEYGMHLHKLAPPAP